MAHVSIFDTSITTSAGEGDQNNGPALYPTVKAKAVLTLQPTQTDFAEYVSGSVSSEKEGVLEVQHSFDYPQDHENEAKALEKSHWSAVEIIKIKNEEGKGFYFFAIAPYFRLVWTQGGETKKEEEEVTKKEKANSNNLNLRIFARAQEKGRL